MASKVSIVMSVSLQYVIIRAEHAPLSDPAKELEYLVDSLIAQHVPRLQMKR